MIRIIVASALLLGACMSLSVAYGEDLGRETVTSLVKEALANNPDLRSLAQKVRAYEERPFQARSLDDPRVSFSLMNLPVDTFRFDQEPMTQKQISIMQRFPFPGKLDLRGDMADRELESVRMEYEEKRNSLTAQVRKAINNLLFVRKAREVAEKNRDIVREQIETVATRYEVGKSQQQELLSAQIELTRITNRIVSYEQRLKTAEARVNTLLGRPVLSPLGVEGDLEITDLKVNAGELHGMAEEFRPLLIGLRSRIEQAESAYQLAGKDYYPDFDVGLSYGQRDDSESAHRPDFFSASVAVNIPLWYRSKESRKVAEERANLRRVRGQYESARNDVLFQIQDLLNEIERYDQELHLLESGLVPQSELSLESALAAYRVNRTDFSTVVNSQVRLFDLELAYFQALTDRENRIADLVAAVGHDFLQTFAGITGEEGREDQP